MNLDIPAPVGNLIGASSGAFATCGWSKTGIECYANSHYLSDGVVPPSGPTAKEIVKAAVGIAISAVVSAQRTLVTFVASDACLVRRVQLWVDGTYSIWSLYPMEDALTSEFVVDISVR